MKIKSTSLIVGMLVIQLVLTIVMVAQLTSISDNTSVFKALVGDAPQAAPSAPSAAPQPAAKVEVSEDDDPVKGVKNAPVTIIEFSDFQCPYCGRFFSETLPSIEQKYIQSGKVKMVYRDFPLSFHPEAQPAAEAAECAKEQGKFWEFHDKIFENQQGMSAAAYKQWASEVGLNTAQFNSCVDSGKYRQEVQKDFAEGSSYGVSGTPSFFINGMMVSGAQPYQVFEQAIEAALAGN